MSFWGEFRVGNLDLRADGIAEIDISFRLDGNGMLHVAAKDVVSGRTVEMKMRNYGESIREDEDFDSSVTQERHRLGWVTHRLHEDREGLDVQIQHKQLAPSVDDKTQQVAKRMRDLMAVVEYDDTEEPTVLDGEVIENVFGSVDDEPENLEISLGGPAISLGAAIIEEVEDTPAVGVSVAASIVEESTEEESSEEYVLELVPEEEEVFELGEPTDAPAEVQNQI